MARKVRRSKYHTNVLPNLELIKELRESGVSIEDIYKQLDVKASSWYEYINKFPELEEALFVEKFVVVMPEPTIKKYDKREIKPLTRDDVHNSTFELTILIQNDPEELDEEDELVLVIRKYDTVFHRFN